MIHVILDLETLSTETNAAILQIGAVAIDKEFDTIRTRSFESRIGEQEAYKSQTLFDRYVCDNTVKWWDEVSRPTRDIVFAPQEAYAQAMMYFSNWVKSLGEKDKILMWGRGPEFDNTILASSLKACNLEIPWNFRNNRCMRTLMDITKIDPKEVPRLSNETEHTALGDARFEARLFLLAEAKLAILTDRNVLL